MSPRLPPVKAPLFRIGNRPAVMVKRSDLEALVRAARAAADDSGTGTRIHAALVPIEKELAR